MQNTKMIKNVNNLGQIYLPIEIREQVGLSLFDLVEWYIDKGEICIKKFIGPCMITKEKSEKNMSLANGKIWINEEYVDYLIKELKLYIS